MLRVYQSTTASDAKRYFTEGLAQEDYYTDRSIEGVWGGKAAERLGLSGTVERDPFARICENKHPETGERLTPRTRYDRTVGYDWTFSTPKGVSLLHAMTRDERILDAMRDAVDRTMAEVEARTQTRVRLNDKSEDRHTGNLVWARFTHFTARPEEGEPDPHLHMHVFCQNLTWDPEEARWKAAQFRPVVRDHPYFQAAYHARLAANLQSIGYEVGRHPTGWDLDGIDRSLVEKFSRRTERIEKTAKRLGITDAEEKGQLGARTRSKKGAPLTADELQGRWFERMTEAEREWLFARAQGPRRDAEPDGQQHDRQPRDRDRSQGLTPDQALDHAIEHTFARKSVESATRVVAEALRHGLHQCSPEEIWAALDARPEILSKTEHAERFVTTRKVHAEEKAVLEFAVSGKGKELPLGQGLGGRSGEAYEIGRKAEQDGIELNDRQNAAVEHLLSSRDRVMLLRGGAGTGKTTLLTEAAAAIQHGGSKVFACAVTADASRGVLRDAGFDQAETLEKLLVDPKLHDRIRGQVVWVDEAGMVGTPTMKRLFDLAEKTDARVILAGDTKQHAPVERGDAMGLLERQGEIRPAEVDAIVRQKGVYKEAVHAMEKGELTKSVQLLDEMGAIREIRDFDGPERRHTELADRYVEVVSSGKSALVVSPTHAEGRAVTDQIREKLKANDRIRGEEKTVTRLQDTQWTDAQKVDAHNYEVGMVVQYTQHCRGVPARDIPPATAGMKAKVIGVDAKAGLITTEDSAGNRRPLHTDTPDRFAVFKEQDLKLARGDTVRITRNSRTMDGRHRLNNGDHYRVAGFTEEGHIQLANKGKWVVSKDTGHVNHGYCVTPQAGQGKSAQVCLAALGAAGLSASSLNQLYVVLSRGKETVELLTDKRSSLIKAVGRLATTRSATELMASDGSATTREQRLLRHSREVQRLQAFEETRRVQRQGYRSRGVPPRQPRGRGGRDGRNRRGGRDGRGGRGGRGRDR